MRIYSESIRNKENWITQKNGTCEFEYNYIDVIWYKTAKSQNKVRA